MRASRAEEKGWKASNLAILPEASEVKDEVFKGHGVLPDLVEAVCLKEGGARGGLVEEVQRHGFL